MPEAVSGTVSYLVMPNVLRVFHHPFILKMPYVLSWEKG